MRDSLKNQPCGMIAETSATKDASRGQRVFDPDVVLDLIFNDIHRLLKEKYASLTQDTALFNMSRLHSLLGGQFRIARMAREQGFLLQDCEMCIHYDRQLSHCRYYQLIFTRKDEQYYYGALCPALQTK